MQASVTNPPARYNVADVQAIVRQVATAVDVAPDDAARFAEALVEADVCGTSTHGVSRLGIYMRRIRRGLIQPRAKLRIERERAATLALDAGNGLGQVMALQALDLLMPRAKAAGVAAATIRQSQHFGALSYYCNLAAERGQILFATTNGEPAMSPAGGCQPYFGTNPIAVSFPTGKGFPIKIDLATSIVARGNIIAAQKQGRPIPAGWALDPAGEPTTDAAAALLGTVLTMAGHKGFALALMVETFSGVLSGAAVGSAIGSMYKDLDRPQDVGHFFLLLDISAFLDLAEFTRRMDRAIDEIKACRKRPGVEEILVPGERSHRVALRNRRDGIPIDPATHKELAELCREFEIPFTLVPLPAGS
jgi:LDH2 family malate/lactate/ureidoglycolate dehydrogenase